MNSAEKQTAREQLGLSETSYVVTTRAQAQQQRTWEENTNTLSQPELKHNNRELRKKTQIHCHHQSSSTTTGKTQSTNRKKTQRVPN